ncbi:MAG: peptide chain release factor 2 [Xanthomonadales bacterium]|nr:peptide chain release factor 2 [Xanthomonadales bacterium]
MKCFESGGPADVEINQLTNLLVDLSERAEALRGYLDYPVKRDRLEEVNRELENPAIWSKPEQAQALGRERAQLTNIVRTLDELSRGLAEAGEMLGLAVEEQDAETAAAVGADLERMEERVERLEFQRMFSGEMDSRPCFLDIQAGSGGTEAQDWAEMLLRMYLRWAERRGWQTDLVEVSYGDVAGIKSATVHIVGDYAYGWCRTETGVHRLVRKSPFDSGNRRHTSFAAVFASPEVDDDIEVDMNPADLRIDVYRASGAGGQHVNTTDSAVRITHLPTGIVVQCQNDRSQHKNKDHALKQIEAHQKLEDTKSDIGWGSQIRSYVLDQSRIKDLRTGVEVGNTQSVLDGDLDAFVEASLKQGL